MCASPSPRLISAPEGPRWTTTRTTPAEGRAERGQNVRVDDRADESLARAALLARRAGRCARDDGHAAATWRV